LPASLRLVFDRELQATDIPKRDDRGRTLDIHALRTTFATWLSLADVSPRTAQAALRHSDIKLTMGTYTDARLLDTRRAIEKLPLLPLPGRTDASVHQSVTSPVTSATVEMGQIESVRVTTARMKNRANEAGGRAKTPGNSTKKPASQPESTGGSESDRGDLNPRPLAPQAQLRQAPFPRLHQLDTMLSHLLEPLQLTMPKTSFNSR
jgi:hypothetical protein